MITDYASLKQAILDWSHRSDLTSYLDEFIAMSEGMMASDLRVREMETTVTGNLSGTTITLPTGIAELRRFVINSTPAYSPIQTSPEGLKISGDTTSGLPDYMAFVDDRIEFNRSVTGYTYTIDYWAKPTPITSSNTTSTLLSAYPFIYLFGALVASAWFTKNDQDMQRYQAKYLDYLKSANGINKPVGGPMRVMLG